MSSQHILSTDPRSKHGGSKASSSSQPSSPSQLAYAAAELARPSSDITEESRPSGSITSCTTAIESVTALLSSQPLESGPITKCETSGNKGSPNVSVKERRILSSWWWWWEIGAALVNITCMCLLVATLLSIEDKPLSYWRLKISPNSVIAVLTTVAKTSLLVPVAESISQLKWMHFDHPNPLSDLQMFDDASRGPWGAWTFLCHKTAPRRINNTLFASVGCLITLLSLAFEPTAQQILSFPTRSVKDTGGSASVGAATQLDFELPFDSPIISEIDGYTPFAKAPPLPIQLATFAGLANGTTNLNTNCSTSHCRFGDIRSLGVCANCEDLTSKLIRNCTHHPSEVLLIGMYYPNDSWNCTFRTDATRPRTVGNMSLYGWAFDDQPIIDIRASVGASWNHYKDKCGGFTTIRRRGPDDVPYLYNMDDFKSADESVLTADLVESHSCSWEWCERTYTNFNILNGEPQYEVVKTQSLVPVHKQTETNWNRYGFWHGTNEMATNDSSPRVYRISRASELSIFVYLASLLHKTLWSSTDVQPDPIIQILAQQDIHTTTHNIALSLSNALQNPVNTNATLIAGIALQQQVFVQVRWAWLVIPASLSIAGAVLFVVCIISSDASPTPLLKSSALASLLHGLAGFSEDQMRPPSCEDSKALTDKTKSMTAQLRRGAEGVLKFEKVE